jgi:hypothetical protein
MILKRKERKIQGFEPRPSLQLEPFTFCRALAATYTTIVFFGVDLRFSITVYKDKIVGFWRYRGDGALQMR